MPTIKDRLNEAGKDIEWLKRKFANSDLTQDLIESVRLPIDPNDPDEYTKVHLVYLAGKDQARIFTDWDLAKAHFRVNQGHDLGPEIRYKYKQSDDGLVVNL